MNEKVRNILLGTVLNLIGFISVTKGVHYEEMFAFIAGFFSVFVGIYFFFELGSQDIS